jgi:hypothetical protein
LLTQDFRKSKWTDQEVGFALGKGVLVVPVSLEIHPYGFIGKHQGLKGSLSEPDTLASDLVDVFLKQTTTGMIMREALVVALEKAGSYITANTVAGKIGKQVNWSPSQIKRMQKALADNSQVSDAFNAPGIIKRIAKVS